MQRTAVALAQPEMLRNSQRNAGIPLRPEAFEAIQVNLSAVERRAATLPTRRSVKKEYQAAWLVKALTCIDLTTLAGDDTPGRVQRLCAKAMRPLSDALLKGLGLEDSTADGGRSLRVSDNGSSRGQGAERLRASRWLRSPPASRPVSPRCRSGSRKSRYAVGEGAGEIDIVINRALVFDQEWQALYDEVAAMREACGEAHLKAILATGDLKTLRNVYKASMVSMQAGADFIKTSTGKEDVNATLPVSLVMIRALRDYRR